MRFDWKGFSKFSVKNRRQIEVLLIKIRLNTVVINAKAGHALELSELELQRQDRVSNNSKALI
jgi:hypothetical protein